MKEQMPVPGKKQAMFELWSGQSLKETHHAAHVRSTQGVLRKVDATISKIDHRLKTQAPRPSNGQSRGR